MIEIKIRGKNEVLGIIILSPGNKQISNIVVVEGCSFCLHDTQYIIYCSRMLLLNTIIVFVNFVLSIRDK